MHRAHLVTVYRAQVLGEAHEHLRSGQLYVSKFLSDRMDVMLGADADDQSQTSDQPWVAGNNGIN